MADPAPPAPPPLASASTSDRSKRKRNSRRGGNDRNITNSNAAINDAADGNVATKKPKNNHPHHHRQQSPSPPLPPWRTTPKWKQDETPSFLDATATVSVATFASRRLPELKQLYYGASLSVKKGDDSPSTLAATVASFRPELALQSGGGKRSTRHLRRRTGAVRSKTHRHRYPSGGVRATATATTTLRTGQPVPTTTAADESPDDADEDVGTGRPPPDHNDGMEFRGTTRKSRRKKAGLLSHGRWDWLATATTMENENGPETSRGRDVVVAAAAAVANVDGADALGGGQSLSSHPNSFSNSVSNPSHASRPSHAPSSSPTNWLATHLWHAKRFHMGMLWGWAVPLAHTNRGSRAALRLSSTTTSSSSPSYCMLRDISWERQPLLLAVTLLPTSAAAGSNSSSNTSNSRRSQMTVLLLKALGRVCPDVVSASHGTSISGSSSNDDDRQDSSVPSLFSGASMIEAVLHEVDQFPRNAIGPVWWRIVHPSSVDATRRRDGGEEEKGPSSTAATTMCTVEVRCHPSIRTQVVDCLTALMSQMAVLASSSSMSPPPPLMMEWETNTTTPRGENRRNNRPPWICFRLYGPSSTRVLDKLIVDESPAISVNEESISGKGSHLVWNQVVSYLQDRGSTKDRDQDYAVRPLFHHGSVVTISKASVKSKAGRSTTGECSSEADDLMLVYQSPRPLDCAANRGMSGWEIYCGDANLARDLWIALATTSVHGDADPNMLDPATSPTTCSCVIGMVEDSRLRLECEPPIPVFPRDYVDTKESVAYWRTSDAVGGMKQSEATTTVHNASREWQRIRQLYEGGWGRLPIGKSLEKCIERKSLAAVGFHELLSSTIRMGTKTSTDVSDISENMELVTVRGSYGYPFVNAIRGCACFDDVVADEGDADFAEKGSRRRKRRKSRPRNQATCAPLLSRSERESFASTCQQLLASLTLPAVLLVHVRSLGKGSISAGMHILSLTKDVSVDDGDGILTLGRITTGSFSPSRGACHGLGIVGASVLLEYLARNAGAGNNCGRLVRLTNGRLSLQLLVSVCTVQSHLKSNEACLSLVFD